MQTNQKIHQASFNRSWWNLTPKECSAADFLGYTKLIWFMKAAMLDFAPIVFPLSDPELEKMNLDYLKTLDVEVAVIDGTIVNGDSRSRNKTR